MTLKLIDHPVGRHAMTILRDKSSTIAQFRAACEQVVPCVLYAATAGFGLKPKRIATPFCEMQGCELEDDIVIVPILRAGVSMLETALKFLPQARVGYFGMQRDKETAVPSTYCKKLPPLEHANVILLDPAVATGGTADYAIQEIQKLSPKTLSFCCLLAAPEGLDRLNDKYAGLPIYTVVVDSHLNEKKYIVPGTLVIDTMAPTSKSCVHLLMVIWQSETRGDESLRLPLDGKAPAALAWIVRRNLRVSKRPFGPCCTCQL
jgi:uracil phosphoribosyltransferase